MNTRLSIVFVALLLLRPPMRAGEHTRLEVLGGPTFSSASSGIFRDWGTGWVLGGGIVYPLNSWIDFGCSVSYHHYPFQAVNLDPYSYPPVLGYSASGAASSALDASVAIQFNAARGPIRPFLSFRSGVYRFSVGEIRTAEWDLFGSHDTTYPASLNTPAVSQTKGFVGVGLGLGFQLGNGIRAELESRFTETLDAGVALMPLLGKLQFDL